MKRRRINVGGLQCILVVIQKINSLNFVIYLLIWKKENLNKEKRKTLEACFSRLSISPIASRHFHPIKFFLNLTPCRSHTKSWICKYFGSRRDFKFILIWKFFQIKRFQAVASMATEAPSQAPSEDLQSLSISDAKVQEPACSSNSSNQYEVFVFDTCCFRIHFSLDLYLNRNLHDLNCIFL